MANFSTSMAWCLMPQFTLSRLLASTALIAVGIAGATLPWRVSDDFDTYPSYFQAFLLAHFCISPIAVGAGIGLIFKRPFWGAWLAVAPIIAVGIVYVLFVMG